MNPKVLFLLLSLISLYASAKHPALQDVNISKCPSVVHHSDQHLMRKPAVDRDGVVFDCGQSEDAITSSSEVMTLSSQPEEIGK